MAIEAVPTTDENKTMYSSYERREYGKVISIDLTTRFIKEFLTAQMWVEQGPIIVKEDNPEEHAKIMEQWKAKVQPFFTHMNEILDTL